MAHWALTEFRHVGRGRPKVTGLTRNIDVRPTTVSLLKLGVFISYVVNIEMKLREIGVHTIIHSPEFLVPRITDFYYLAWIPPFENMNSGLCYKGTHTESAS